MKHLSTQYHKPKWRAFVLDGQYAICFERNTSIISTPVMCSPHPPLCLSVSFNYAPRYHVLKYTQFSNTRVSNKAKYFLQETSPGVLFFSRPLTTHNGPFNVHIFASYAVWRLLPFDTRGRAVWGVADVPEETTKLHGVTSQVTVIFTATAVRTWNH